MATTPICNPHICMVLLGTVRYFGVLCGTEIYWGIREGGGTGGYCGYCRVLEVLWGTVGYWGYLGVIGGTGGYSGGIAGTVRYCG